MTSSAYDFYTLQDELSSVYTSDRYWTAEKILSIAPYLGSPGKRVLELGAGGGQNSVELARLGHHVTAVELVPRFADHARELAKSLPDGVLTVITGDFYQTSLSEHFDFVCYWDGFGLGTDYEQRVLLQRIRSWLNPEGKALIDIYSPWFAASTAGQDYHLGTATRRYDFDFEGCRWLDKWWPTEARDRAATQSLRCYSPADLKLLLEGTGVRLDQILPGGGFDRQSKAYCFPAALPDAISYTAVLLPEK